MNLTVHTERKVRRAVIPAAGFGTRLFPATKVVKKQLFPIIDRDGRAKPVIMAIVEEAISGGIEEVGIVVQLGDRHFLRISLELSRRQNFSTNCRRRIRNIASIYKI
jgi:UTP-glucose-1-phosphate uridylyltransferase